MPNYEYRCRACDHHFEKLQAFGEEPVTECPKCQGALVRVISPTPTIFKGGKPSAQRTQMQGKHEKPIHQTDDGHWEEDGIMDRR